MEQVTDPVTGKTRKVRPAHKCRGTWIARLEVGRDPVTGRPKRVVRSATSRNGALIRLQELRDEFARHGFIPSRSLTVQGWLEQWLVIVHDRVGPGTWRNHRSNVNRHLVPRIGSVPLAALEPRHVRDMYAGMGAAGSVGIRPSVHRTLHKALEDALRERLVHVNVAGLVDAPPGKGTKRGALTTDEARRLLAYVHREDPATGRVVDRFASRWTMALLTGWRRGECLGLEWDRVDLDGHEMDLAWQLRRIGLRHGCGTPDARRGQAGACGKKSPGACPERVLDVPNDEYECRQLDGGLCLVRPKTAASRRIVPIPAPLHADLVVHAEQDTAANPHGLVWRELDGSPVDPDVDGDRWLANLAAAGLPRVVLHEARHTTATLLMEAGVDPQVIKAIMGHSTVVTQQVYKHANTTLMADALGRVAGALYQAEVGGGAG